MENLIRILKSCGVDTAFPLLQLDFADLFEKHLTSGNSHAYDHHEWIMRDVPVIGCVVNAVPRRQFLEELLWEEWFRRDGRTIHHLLTLRKPPHYDEVFVAPEHDDIHPEASFGKTWYVVNDLDMCPALLRGGRETPTP